MIERINELSKISKERKLTEAELKEQQELRKQYIEKFKLNFKTQMKNVYIKEEDGSLTQVGKD
jgi:5-formyltetrahydrofolate cyclo-ligase